MDTRSARSGGGLPRRRFRNKYGVGHQRDIRSLYAASLTILCLKRRSSGDHMSASRLATLFCDREPQREVLPASSEAMASQTAASRLSIIDGS